MFMMILKMSASSFLYVLVTFILWKKLKDKSNRLGIAVVIGLAYGALSVFSTHFGVDYDNMVLNVRDVGPLAAGLFFHPLSGLIAGLVGGIERYIAGEYFNIGYYTRVACSVSTCMAGFLAVFVKIKLLKGKQPSVFQAIMLGSAAEVFHMYSVFLTHRDDLSNASNVVKTCSVPMIVFSGLCLGLCAAVVMGSTQGWHSVINRPKDEQTSVSVKFHAALLMAMTLILIPMFFLSYFLQTQTAIQQARDTLTLVSGDIVETYTKIQNTKDGIEHYLEANVSLIAQTIAEAIRLAGGNDQVDQDYLDRMVELYDLESLCLVDADGQVTGSSGNGVVYASLAMPVLDLGMDSATVLLSERWVASACRSGDGMVQVVDDIENLEEAVKLRGLIDAQSNFHVGNEGEFNIVTNAGNSIMGGHKGKFISRPEMKVLKEHLASGDNFFRGTVYGNDGVNMLQKINDNLFVLTRLPLSEVYEKRDAQTYESLFSYILLFAVVYMVISIMVQAIIVDNLNRVNVSLDKIASGNLNEVVDVRNTMEFANLSADINQTVTVLKGYIAAEKRRMEKELELAHQLQEAAMPKNFSFPNLDIEIYATMDPAREIGGDFYDLFLLGNGILTLVIADVSGKGIPAALFMMRSKTIIRNLAQTGIAPVEILRRANNLLCEGNDVDMFVTVWIGIIDLNTGIMRCANAGHEYPVITGSDGRFSLVKDKHGLALAAMENMKFKEYELYFRKGDRLFVYTDGIPEAINAQNEQYGTGRLTDKLNEVRELPFSEILPAVRKDIQEFSGDTEQFDDITMLGFTYCPE